MMLRRLPSFVFMAALAAASCHSQSDRPKQELRVFLADSLYLPLKMATAGFEAAHPDCRVDLIPSGSVLAARKIVDAQDRADVLAVADYLVIEQLLRPHYADWYACFATNEVVIAYTEASKGAAGLNADNWFDVLSREGIKVGAANPHQDPCGYWAELCWQLADLHYAGVPAPSIRERMTRQCGPPADRRSSSEELLQLLESAAGIDYAFVYLSQARQHRLPALRLPAQVNLGDVQYADLYHRAAIRLPGAADQSRINKRGEPIVYALTIPKNAAHSELAVQYVQYLLGPAGRKVLAEQYLTVADVPWTFDSANLPVALQNIVSPPPASATKPASNPSTNHADGTRPPSAP